MKRLNVISYVLTVLILMFLSIGCGSSQKGQRHDWRETYNYSKQWQPYETTLLFETLKSQYGDKFWNISEDRRLDVILKNAKDQSAYMFVRRYFQPDSSELQALMDYSKRGNDLFIATHAFNSSQLIQLISQPYEVIKTAESVLPDEGELDPFSVNWEWDPYEGEWYNVKRMEVYNSIWKEYVSKGDLSSTEWAHSTYNQVENIAIAQETSHYAYGTKATADLETKTHEGKLWNKRWNHFGFDRLLDTIQNIDSVHPISYYFADGDNDERLISGLKIKNGKGNIYLLSTPIILTNFFLREPENFKVVSTILANVDAEHLYWDDMTRFKANSANYGNSKTYYRFLLSNSSLRKAFYFVCLVAFIYLLLSIKRKQRPIPVMDQNENTSLEYSHSIARLYFLNPNHKVILEKKRKHFAHFINKRYGLLVSDDEEFQHKLAEISGISFKYIHKLYNSYKVADNQSEVKEYLLMQVADLQQHFYSNCK